MTNETYLDMTRKIVFFLHGFHVFIGLYFIILILVIKAHDIAEGATNLISLNIAS